MFICVQAMAKNVLISNLVSEVNHEIVQFKLETHLCFPDINIYV